ncbi:hypothetical protein KZ855_37450, partial [Pseudomonas aeruginosa]|nr:hypothetical protein [Pseudomonas aeruginosa]
CSLVGSEMCIRDRLNREAAARGSTLLASLHAVDLALQHFPRVIGLRAGRIAFDLPAGEVDRAALDALYANEQLQAERASPAGEPTVVHIPRSVSYTHLRAHETA